MREKKDNNSGSVSFTPKTKTPEQSLAQLMRYCSRAERSSGDALRLMKRWGVTDGDAAGIMKKLTTLRFIDDERFAEAYVRDKTEFAGWGIYKIRSSLKTKGVSDEIVARVLAGSEKISSPSRLEELIVRKAKSVKATSPYELKTKLLRFGLSRGFEYDRVIDAVDKVVKGLPENAK